MESTKEPKVAVVTGASSGIGASVAQNLAAKGYTVVGLARRANRITELAASANVTVHARACDLTVEEQVEEAFKWIEDTFGGVDVLVNCAGLAKLGGIISGSTSDWKRTFDINVMAVKMCSKMAVKTMRNRGDNGFIININSIAGHYVPQNMDFGMYSASKHAAVALTKAFKYELQNLGSKIRVTSVSPGTVLTPMALQVTAAMEGVEYIEGVTTTMTKSHLEPQDVSDAVLYILRTPPRVQICEIEIEPVNQVRG